MLLFSISNKSNFEDVSSISIMSTLLGFLLITQRGIYWSLQIGYSDFQFKNSLTRQYTRVLGSLAKKLPARAFETYPGL